jgi:hypothetical protein
MILGKITPNTTVIITVVYEEFAKSNMAQLKISFNGALFFWFTIYLRDFSKGF